MRYLFLAVFFIGTIGSLHAKNFGVVAPVFAIGEIDMLVWIDNRLKRFEANGEMDRMKNKAIGDIKKSAERPPRVAGIGTTTDPNTFYVDPTLKLGKDIKDTNGNVLFPKGTTINPFDSKTWPSKSYPQMVFSKVLIFIDGDDEQQISWAKNFKSEKKIKWILINGSPNEISEKLNDRIYFDQNGTLTTKLRIKNVPSVVGQSGTRWKIEEINVSTQPLQEQK